MALMFYSDRSGYDEALYHHDDDGRGDDARRDQGAPPAQ